MLNDYFDIALEFVDFGLGKSQQRVPEGSFFRGSLIREWSICSKFLYPYDFKSQFPSSSGNQNTVPTAG